FAEILRGLLRSPVDVLGYAVRALGDPDRGLFVGGSERASEGAGGATEDDSSDAFLKRCFEHTERSYDVGLDERGTRMRCYVGLVERSRVDDPIDAAHAASDKVRIRDGADMGREGRIDKVNPYDLVAAISKSPDKPLTEVAGASRNEDTHKREIAFLLPNEMGVQRRAKGASAATPG